MSKDMSKHISKTHVQVHVRAHGWQLRVRTALGQSAADLTSWLSSMEQLKEYGPFCICCRCHRASWPCEPLLGQQLRQPVRECGLDWRAAHGCEVRRAAQGARHVLRGRQVVPVVASDARTRLSARGAQAPDGCVSLSIQPLRPNHHSPSHHGPGVMTKSL